MRIAVVGTGYVGLVSGACFSELGINVTCVDKDQRKIESLLSGKIPIFEPGLDKIVKKNHKKKRLRFTTDLSEAVKGVDAVFIAVGTPPDGDEGGADLSFVYGVAGELAKVIDNNTLIVTKSTVPVGTGDRIKAIIKRKNPKLKFSVASNPEFLREGCAVKDFMQPDRIIVGIENDKDKKKLEKLYKPLTRKKFPILFTDIRTAELTKYAANAFLATKIGFINEIADICEKVGANIENVAKGMGMDNRIGANYLFPGPGFGGSCFPKDTLALRKISKDVGAPTKIVESVIYSNEKRKLSMAEKVIEACGGSVKSKTIAILGLAFKANTDDMRHSSSLMILPVLRRAGAHLKVYDPEAMEQAKPLLSEEKTYWCKNSYDALSGADAAVIITEWDEFKKISLRKAKKLMKKPTIIDLRNLFSPEEMKKNGFKYSSIGR